VPVEVRRVVGLGELLGLHDDAALTAISIEHVA
jgi:hypothetical protein